MNVVQRKEIRAWCKRNNGEGVVGVNVRGKCEGWRGCRKGRRVSLPFHKNYGENSNSLCVFLWSLKEHQKLNENWTLGHFTQSHKPIYHQIQRQLLYPFHYNTHFLPKLHTLQNTLPWFNCFLKKKTNKNKKYIFRLKSQHAFEKK